MRSQYRDFVLHWEQLCERKDVLELVLQPQPQRTQAKARGLQPQGKRFTATSSTGISSNFAQAAAIHILLPMQANEEV